MTAASIWLIKRSMIISDLAEYPEQSTPKQAKCANSWRFSFYNSVRILLGYITYGIEYIHSVIEQNIPEGIHIPKGEVCPFYIDDSINYTLPEKENTVMFYFSRMALLRHVYKKEDGTVDIDRVPEYYDSFHNRCKLIESEYKNLPAIFDRCMKVGNYEKAKAVISAIKLINNDIINVMEDYFSVFDADCEAYLAEHGFKAPYADFEPLKVNKQLRRYFASINQC